MYARSLRFVTHKAVSAAFPPATSHDPVTAIHAANDAEQNGISIVDQPKPMAATIASSEMVQQQTPPVYGEVLRIKEMLRYTGLSRSMAYLKLGSGKYRDETFPRPIRLGQRAVGWRKVELDRWLQTRPETKRS